MDGDLSQPSVKDSKEKVEKDFSHVIGNCFQDAVKELTDISIILEDWDYYQGGLNQSKMQESLSRYEDMLQQMKHMISGANMPQVPLGLINHIDLGLSPTTWLKELFDDLTTENDLARGEAKSIQTFRENFLDENWADKNNSNFASEEKTVENDGEVME
eukprot:GDKJ01032839.1.p1 GENE.GDKJ01032839.1~~GDKJ01032839.1.p1  ORF type:complete len:159 (+),score=39.51 GDKJ01032839.1:32-508(+)